MSRISSHSSRRGISRMKFCRPPHARCASSATISHISSKRPSAWSFMKRISKVAGAAEVGGGGRSGSTGGGIAANAPAMPVPTEALTKRPKSSAGQVVKCPARRKTNVSTIGQPRSGLKNLLTIGARCCVISPDCIQNVDNPQVLAQSDLPARRASKESATTNRPPPGGVWRSSEVVRSLDHQSPGEVEEMIRIGVSAWRLSPRPQRVVIRRTTAATSSSGSPTGQTEAAAARSGAAPPSPARSEDASLSRA